MIRTHNAGSLRAADAGSTVTLAGWVARRRDHGGVIFVDLRDGSGVVQVVFREEDAHALRNEFCVKVTGEVTRRPEGNENPELPTGEVEVTASELEVLSEAAPLPLPVDDQIEAGDDIRLKYRYLDLRRSGPAKAMRLRSRASQIARTVLHERDFLEIETPTLTRSTPEGARDFLVPVRLQPGSWYALPQSPQLFKQLLMVGGMERYYQIARCYRTRTSAPTGSRSSRSSTSRCPSSPRTTSSTWVRRSSRRSGPSWPATRSPGRSRGSPGTTRWPATAPTSPTCATGWS